MLRPYNEPILSSLPKRVSLQDYLLALHLGQGRGIESQYLLHRYPRSLTEICSDQLNLLVKSCTRWLRRRQRLVSTVFSVMKTVGLLLLSTLLGLILTATLLMAQTRMEDDFSPCWVNYKTVQHETKDETDYSAGLETHYFDTNWDGLVDTILMFQITTEGQGDLVYATNRVPLFIALDKDQDGVAEIMGVLDEEVGDCRIY